MSYHLIFWVSLLVLVYIYLGYPLLVWCLGAITKKDVNKQDALPPLTILISAFNEAEHIARTVTNKLCLDYPPDKLEVMVISDGSDDGTDEIVNRLGAANVRLLRQEPRAGKTAALNLAVPRSLGEVLVFSDANSLYQPDAARKLVRNFADPGVGYVSGQMLYANPDGSLMGEGCSAYMKYENWLRRQETRLGSIVGVDGGIDAIRRRLYHPMRPDQLPDFVLPLRVVQAGQRVVYEPEAILREPALSSLEDEYRMRVRVSLRALWALWDMRRLLWPYPDPLFAWQLFSHKLLRYLAFLFLAGLYVSSWTLRKNSHFYESFLLFQSAFYLAAIICSLAEKFKLKVRFLYTPYYFCTLNLSAAHAFFKFLLGQKRVVWTPRKG